jgi:Na+/proline symporter
MKPATMLSVLVLAMVAVGHLLRLVLGVEIRIGGIIVPLWVSVIACVVPAGLAVALWRENRDA